MANHADLNVGAHISLAPFLQLSLLYVNLRLVHDLQVEFVVVFGSLELTVLHALDHLENVVAPHDDLLLLVTSHVVVNDLCNDLGLQHLPELLNRVLVLSSILLKESVELFRVSFLDFVSSDLAVGGTHVLCLNLSQTAVEVADVH